MNLQELKMFIFDMDGTLVDSRLNFDLMREELGFPEGVPLLEHIESLMGTKDEETIAGYYDVIHRHELAGAHASEVISGVENFLSFLKTKGVETAVLTRNSKEVTDITFKKWNLSFSQVLTRDCVVRPKPDPEGLLTICREANIEPHQAVYIGDYLFDIEAAHNAGMKGILFSALADKRNLQEMMRRADVTVDSYVELTERFEESFLKPLELTLPSR